jgi:glycosyltransferase involved in cell wall biosynthesis
MSEVGTESSLRTHLETQPPQYSIIVPAYNEGARIGNTLEEILEHIHREGWNAEVVVVDDGSSDETVAIAGKFAANHPEMRIIRNPSNRGKGYSVRNGMLQAKGKILLFTDADLSSPIAEAGKLFAALEAGADVAIGSRWMDPSLQFQRQSLKRQILSRLYHRFLKIILLIPYHDTQCGFKAFTRAAAGKIFPLQRVMRWGFDPEILYLAHRQGLKVAEIPVRWGHDDGSRLRVWRDGARMGWDALKVRWYALSRKYRV